MAGHSAPPTVAPGLPDLARARVAVRRRLAGLLQAGATVPELAAVVGVGARRGVIPGCSAETTTVARHVGREAAIVVVVTVAVSRSTIAALGVLPTVPTALAPSDPVLIGRAPSDLVPIGRVRLDRAMVRRAGGVGRGGTTGPVALVRIATGLTALGPRAVGPRVPVVAALDVALDVAVLVVTAQVVVVPGVTTTGPGGDCHRDASRSR